jgi:hypothetical protein
MALTTSPISLQVPQKYCILSQSPTNTKTPKLTKKSENNKDKGLANAN